MNNKLDLLHIQLHSTYDRMNGLFEKIGGSTLLIQAECTQAEPQTPEKNGENNN